MFPKAHIILGAIFSLLLFLIFPELDKFGLILVFLSSFLIDVDHYLYYVFEKGNLSLAKAYRWFCESHAYVMKLSRVERTKHKGCLLFLHGIEPMFIIYLLGVYVNNLFNYILIGCLFHLILDYLYEMNFHNRIDKVSVIYDYLKFKRY